MSEKTRCEDCQCSPCNCEEQWHKEMELVRENGFNIRATLRRVLPKGSTVWTVTQHVTRSGRVFVLPQAFLAVPSDPAQPDSIFGTPKICL